MPASTGLASDSLDLGVGLRDDGGVFGGGVGDDGLGDDGLGGLGALGDLE
jgi:hypothetical protein